MLADRLAAGAGALERAQVLEQLVAARSDGVRQAREQRPRLVVRAFAELLRPEGGIAVVRGQQRVHAGRHLAQPAQAREQVRGVGKRGERVLPAVARVREELLQDSERRRQRRSGVAVGAEQPGRVLEAVRVQEAQHLELGALAGLEPAVGLERTAPAEHDRAVGLLAADRSRRLQLGVAGQLRGELEADLAGGRRKARRAAQGAEQRLCERRIGKVEHHLPVPGEAVGKLVELAAAVGELGLEERQRAVRRQRSAVDDATAREGARLGAEPALLAHERRQRALAHSSTRSR